MAAYTALNRLDIAIADKQIIDAELGYLGQHSELVLPQGLIHTDCLEYAP